MTYLQVSLAFFGTCLNLLIAFYLFYYFFFFAISLSNIEVFSIFQSLCFTHVFVSSSINCYCYTTLIITFLLLFLPKSLLDACWFLLIHCFKLFCFVCTIRCTFYVLCSPSSHLFSYHVFEDIQQTSPSLVNLFS